MIATCVLASLLGCDAKRDGRDLSNPAAFVDLALTKASENRQIIDEVARIEAEGWILTPTSRTRLGSRIEPATVANESFADTFNSRDARTIYQSTTAVYPAEEFTFSPEQLAEAVRIRQTGDLFLARFRGYVQPGPRDFGVDLRAGLLADTSFVPVVRAAHRLEAFEAAAMLQRGNLESATDRLVSMLLISDRLDDLPHLVARLTAVELREEAAYVAEAIANHDRADANTHLRMANLVAAHLARWPSDAEVWRGDRAIGLHAYEMMRAGELLSLLTDQEVDSLKERGQLFQVTNQLVANVDGDQLFYLTTMSELIAACDQPWRRRSGVIASTEDRMVALHGTPEDPYLASRVLLTNLRTANESLAMDRATWSALATLLSKEGESGIDPFTGEAFQVSSEGDRRSIAFEANHERQRTVAIR